MGLLDGLFGRKKAATPQSEPPAAPMAPTLSNRPTPKPSNDIFQKLQMLEDRRKVIQRRIDELDRQVELDLNEAKQMLLKNQKARAEIILKRKKMKETERQNKINFILTLDQQIQDIVSMMGQMEDVRALEVIRDLQGHMMKEMNPEKVEKLQEDMEESRDRLREVSDVLYAAPLSEHDLEVENELKELLGELEMEAKAALPQAEVRPMPAAAAPASAEAASGLTVAPKGQVNKEVEDELAKLEKEMAMMAS